MKFNEDSYLSPALNSQLLTFLLSINNESDLERTCWFNYLTLVPPIRFKSQRAKSERPALLQTMAN